VRETSLTLLDVRAAVEWVHENIQQFGGDRDNILVSSSRKLHHSNGFGIDVYSCGESPKALGW
jgi:hypothetical protein